MPATFTELLPATKTAPHTAIRWTPSGTTPNAGLLSIQSKRTDCEYLVVEGEARYPVRVFSFFKVEGKAGSDAGESGYTVAVGVAGSPCSCTCKGFTYGRRCKHVEAAVAVIDNGWMRSDLVNPAQDVSGREAF